MENLKELVRHTIREKEKDNRALYKSVINKPVQNYIDSLQDLDDQGFVDAVKQLGQEKQKASAIIQHADFLNKNAPGPKITKGVLNKYVSNARVDDFDFDKAADDFANDIENGEGSDIKKDVNIDTQRVVPLTVGNQRFSKKEKKALDMVNESKKQQIKESIKKYILENYIKEQDEDNPVLKDLDPEVADVKKNLFNTVDEKLLQSLRDIVSVEQSGQLLVQVIDFLNKVTPAPRLDKDLAVKFIQGAESRDFDVDDREAEPEVDIDAEEEETLDEVQGGNRYQMALQDFVDNVVIKKSTMPGYERALRSSMKGEGFSDDDIDAFIRTLTKVEENSVSEESTTAGAPAPATKYAFRRKKK